MARVVGHVARLLGMTRDHELDCDEYRELLAAYVEDGLSETEIRTLMDHHRAMCPECDEEYQLLLRALGRSA